MFGERVIILTLHQTVPTRRRQGYRHVISAANGFSKSLVRLPTSVTYTTDLEDDVPGHRSGLLRARSCGFHEIDLPCQSAVRRVVEFTAHVQAMKLVAFGAQSGQPQALLDFYRIPCSRCHVRQQRGGSQPMSSPAARHDEYDEADGQNTRMGCKSRNKPLWLPKTSYVLTASTFLPRLSYDPCMSTIALPVLSTLPGLLCRLHSSAPRNPGALPITRTSLFYIHYNQLLIH